MRRALLACLLAVTPRALAAQAAADDSPHAPRFVAVSPAVRLEVLDWGGTGRPVVLLAGRGNTAHVFDSLAVKLRADYHVVGITRRGFGNSTRATSGYLSDSLGDDVLAVLDSLGLARPVVIGHSLAGEELSSIGSRRPDRVAGLVYLDAGDHFAFFDSTGRHSPALLRDTERKLARLDDPAVGLTLGERSALVTELLARLPLVERDLREWKGEIEILPDQSRVVPPADPNAVNRALALGQQVYATVKAPVLAFFALPSHAPAAMAGDSAATAAFNARRAAELSRIAAFERGIPGSRVIILADANHYVFRSNEAEVLTGIRRFISALPK